MRHPNSTNGFIAVMLFTMVILSSYPVLGQTLPINTYPIPRTMTYQGVLDQSNGSPVPNGTYILTFKLYQPSSLLPPILLWSETQNVKVTSGLFNVTLGSVTPIDLPFNRQYLLGVFIGTDSSLTPLMRLNSSPYAIHAIYADSLTAAAGGALTGSYPNPGIASGEVVKSINTLKDSVTLAAGSNVTITPSGNTLTISATGGSGGGTITGVTAGTGLTGGGTSGNVTLSAATPFRLTNNSNLAVDSISNTGSGRGLYTSSYYGTAIYAENTGPAVNSPAIYGASSNNTGVYGISNRYQMIGVSGNSPYQGVGVQGSAVGYGGMGVEGIATGSSSGNYAGYFNGDVQVMGNFAVQGGTKAAEVKLDNGTPVLFYCEEATEVYFVDYGEGQLVNGRAHISVDPEFLQTVTVNAQNPMMVFVQVLGNCNGVYVTNETPTSFDVVELKNGSSNVSFFYRIVCKRRYFSSLRMSTPSEADAVTHKVMAREWPQVVAQQAQAAEQMKAVETKTNAAPQR